MMKLLSNLSNTEFSFPNYEHFYNFFIVLLKSLLILFCALFPFFLGFKYFKTSDEEQPLFEEDRNEALQERINFDENENPFSVLTFRFPTYDDFLKTIENVVSNENDYLEEHCSIPSSPVPDLDCKNEVGIEDEFPTYDEFLKTTENVDSNENDYHEEQCSIHSSPVPDLDCKNEDGIEDDDDGIDEFNDSIEASEIDDSEDDFIKALQDQIMKAKANAKAKSVLPSIPEETEYSISDENDLKPWKKKEESFNYRDLRKELNRFHKLYIEQMRKYDTLNHQKTYAKELKRMQSKGSAELVVSTGFCACKGEKKRGEKRGGIDGEMEMVYVVQLMVSWEFIVWEYKKAMEIYGRDEGYYGSCRFNGVAEKFEHFKVMIQRFMENERFDEGSRVECYVRNRLATRKLLQVPLLKEDEVKDNKNKEGLEEDDKQNIVTMDKIIKILQESIRMLWEFIKTDKLVHISTLKCHLEAKQECTSPSHSKIQTQILLDLQKKERKLKKIVKRKTCIKLKNCKEDLEEEEEEEEDSNDDELCFLTMVDLKLVSRMLNMQRITRKELNWCHHKLSCITFPNGKIKIQPSSFLFSSS